MRRNSVYVHTRDSVQTYCNISRLSTCVKINPGWWKSRKSRISGSWKKRWNSLITLKQTPTMSDFNYFHVSRTKFYVEFEFKIRFFVTLVPGRVCWFFRSLRLKMRVFGTQRGFFSFSMLRPPVFPISGSFKCHCSLVLVTKQLLDRRKVLAPSASSEQSWRQLRWSGGTFSEMCRRIPKLS